MAMSMATADLDHLDTENTTTGPTPTKGNVPTETLTPTVETTASKADSGTTGAAEEGDVDDDDRSIHFVTIEPDTPANTVITTTTTTTTEEPPFEGDGVDPAEALIPSRSTFDWLAYTVSLNYNRLATSVFSPITRWNWYDPVPHTSIILGAVPSQQLLVHLQRGHAIQDIVNMCAEFKGHLQTMTELGLVQSGRGRSATVVLCWLVYCYKLTVVEAQVILLKARGQVDKNVYLHPEVVSFYDQVQEQEKNGVLERKVWPGNNSHSQVDNNNGSNDSSSGGGGGRTGECSGGTSGDA
ncbi:hypothetical protein KI688_005440 [Linnemannia hyalina]|uniref:Protein-tyrosine-phosphatase n=1 Tax=Linnemannia hyalina TaxID=64524 RepID=A0A9P7XJQ3_9FUNG|nr:hypothetical protein KI688_005440 [Linnemannia hyalina]